MDESEELMERMEQAAGRLDDEAQERLLSILTNTVASEKVEMTFQQAMQIASRCQARLEAEQQYYTYYRAVLQGEAELSPMTQATHLRDGQGRPVVATLPISEILEQEIPEPKKREEVVTSFFAAVNNYFAKRVTRWVEQVAIHMAIAVSKMPKPKQ